MRFTPTTAQLEKIAELETARMPVALIADRLGVDQATFKVWTARLNAHRDYVDPTPSTAEILRKQFSDRAQRKHESQVVADRMFEGD